MITPLKKTKFLKVSCFLALVVPAFTFSHIKHEPASVYDLQSSYNSNPSFFNDESSISMFYFKGGYYTTSEDHGPSVGLGYRYLNQYGIDAFFSLSDALSTKVVGLYSFLENDKLSLYAGPGFGLNIGGGFFTAHEYASLEGLIGIQMKTEGYWPRFLQLELSKPISTYNDPFSVTMTTGFSF